MGVQCRTFRHLPVFVQCVEPTDPIMLMTRCARPDQLVADEFVLFLTAHRLVVTQESRVLRRLRLHLNANLSHLSNVMWSPDDRQSALEVGVTAIDGVRERFLIKLDGPDQVSEVEAQFRTAFEDLATRRSETMIAVAA
jgi:hypothetical protein